MHNVELGGETQLIFAVLGDCFPSARGAEPSAMTVAGVDSLYLEPYANDEDMHFGGIATGATTAAYAIPIEDRTLCVYLSWDPETPPDKVESAREVVESIHGQPYRQQGGIRINFLLERGWDTG